MMHLVVFPGQEIENDVGDIRMARSQHGLRASGAVLELEPDQHGFLRLADRRDGLRQVTFGQRQRCQHSATEFHELPARDAPPRQNAA